VEDIIATGELCA